MILYPRSLIDEALYAATNAKDAIVGECQHDDKSARLAAPGGDTGAAESIRKAMTKG